MLKHTPPSNKRLSQITVGRFVGGIEINAWSQINAVATMLTTCTSQTLPRANNSVRDLVENMAKQTTEVHQCYDVSFKLRGVAVTEKESKSSVGRQFKVDQKDYTSLLFG